MQSLVLLALVGFAAAQFQGNAQTNKFAGQYVFDLLKPALTAGEVETLLASREAIYPTYSEIPQTKFNCASKNQAGFYTDIDAQCQVFHRCDLNGNQTSYLCVNSTIFNQITLICDAWYNVDCQGSQQYEDYANSRLYTDLPLFDTPPADYVAPSQIAAQNAQQALLQQGVAAQQGSTGQQGASGNAQRTQQSVSRGNAQRNNQAASRGNSQRNQQAISRGNALAASNSRLVARNTQPAQTSNSFDQSSAVVVQE